MSVSYVEGTFAQGKSVLGSLVRTSSQPVGTFATTNR